MFGFKKKTEAEKSAKRAEKYWSSQERKAYESEVAEARRKAYWEARKEAEVKQASTRGASYKPIGKSISGGLLTIGRGMTAKGGFLDLGETKGRKSSGFNISESSLGIGIGQPKSEFGNWFGEGRTHKLKHHRKVKRSRPRRHSKGYRKIVYYR